MESQFTRTKVLFDTATLERLSQSHVMVFGMGDVGSYVVGVLARSGVGEISLVDNDEVSLSNINRQLVALHSALGQKKVEVVQKRILDINPRCKMHAYALLYLPETTHEINLSACDYMVDYVDTMAAKLEIIKQCDALHMPMIACMGAANKMDATRFKVADISKTQMDPLAEVVRKKLRELGTTHLEVVYNDEQPQKPFPMAPTKEASSVPGSTLSAPVVTNKKRSVPASNASVPATAGLTVGGEVVKGLYNLQSGARSQWE